MIPLFLCFCLLSYDYISFYHKFFLLSFFKVMTQNYISVLAWQLSSGGLYMLRVTTFYTVKKGSRVSRLQPGCHKPNSPWAGIIQLWRHYSRPSLVVTSRLGTENSQTFFYGVCSTQGKNVKGIFTPELLQNGAAT